MIFLLCLEGVERGDTTVAAAALPPPLVLLAPLPPAPLLHGEGAEGPVHDQQDGDEEGGHAGRVHDRVRQVKGLS